MPLFRRRADGQIRDHPNLCRRPTDAISWIGKFLSKKTGYGRAAPSNLARGSMSALSIVDDRVDENKKAFQYRQHLLGQMSIHRKVAALAELSRLRLPRAQWQLSAGFAPPVDCSIARR